MRFSDSTITSKAKWSDGASATVRQQPLTAMLSPWRTASGAPDGQGLGSVSRRNLGPSTTATTGSVRSMMPVNMRGDCTRVPRSRARRVLPK